MKSRITSFAMSLMLAVISSLAIAETQPSTEVDLVKAEPAFRQVSMTGFTRARANLPLVAESTGKVLTVSTDIGGRIDDDGLFAQIDPTFIKLDLQANQVQQQQLRSRIDFDQREVKRYRELIAKGSTSVSRVDELEQALRDSRLQLSALNVQEKILRERLLRTRIKAPSGWRVIQREVEPGQRVNEGEVLGAVADFSQLIVPFSLTPQQYAALRAQQNALTVYLPDWQQRQPAKVYRVNPRFDQATRKISVELVLQGTLPAQRGGLRVRLDLGLPERTGAVILPLAAVVESYDEFWVTRENGERIQVIRLGRLETSAETLLKVASPQIKPGDRFRLIDKE